MSFLQSPTSSKTSSTHITRTTSSLSTARKPANLVGRSHSFAGFSELSSRKKMGSPGNAWARPVLGDLLRSPKMGRKANMTLSGAAASSGSTKSLNESFKKAGLKLPKVPRPQRTITVFQSLKRGIRECIQATEDDLYGLRESDQATSHTSAQARSIELEKQMRAAERYKKRLEFHLSKVEELEEQYFIHQQLREGVKNMAKAYVHHSGGSKKESLSNVKTGFKECTQIMCAIEAQLENLLGTFHCQMKGLLGFARLMAGDVYEISVKHGHQKWKSRGKIGDAKQNWDNETCVLKALLGDMLDVKAVEVKLLSKHSLLGQKRCETKDLFSSHPQMMTVSINPHGTIKLSIFVTWFPLEGVDEGLNVFEPVHRTPSAKRSNYPIIEGYHFAYINGDPDSASLSSSDLSSPSSPRLHRHSLQVSSSAHSDLGHYARPRPLPASVRPVSVAIMDTISESPASWDASSSTSDFGVVKPDVFEKLPVSDPDLSVLRIQPTLEEAVISLKSVLEDYQGQYQELQKLEEQVRALHTLIKGSTSPSNISSQASSDSITIETALEAFDFLESDEYYHDGYGSGKNSRHGSLDHLESTCTLSPESTTKTADSGIESIANRLCEDQALESSFGRSSPEPLLTGNSQVDTVLLWHLGYCERLLENLGNFGPLKCGEIYSLDRLKRQANILERLLTIATTSSQVPDLQTVMTEATKNKELRQFWVRCVDGPVLYASTERFLAQLERTYGELVRDKYEIECNSVLELFLTRMLDLPGYSPHVLSANPVVTMHQLMTFMSDEQQCNIRDYFHTLAGEVWINSRLRCQNTDIVIKTMLTFQKEVPPPAECLRTVALLLITDNSEVRRSAASYLRNLNLYPAARDKVLVVYLESLEDRNPDMRAAAAIGLRLLQASEAMDQLVYLGQSDSSSVVKHMAKDTLLSFGEEGRKAYEESQLTSHGFQGVKVRL